ncbi:Putative auxiliary Activity family 9 [Colletotrichum destructivum]|uniref:lytic cellulose monooxygenase (C4-dehydrogenating) n=1 Tax=Colletotrichum destructivum TaxID=34406 RepID=A0AAX4J4A6_9PEZI|nr:Putative auxiliary Activity family 9 [Colletotrichum destructivum]
MRLHLLPPLATVALAHTIMQSFNGHPQGSGIYMPADDSFISDVNSNSMACNGAPVGYFTSSSDVHTVEAGSEVTGAWLHTLTSTGPDEFADNKVIDSSHKGPVSVWMKKVSDATKNPSSGPGDGWFKISEDGYTNGKWGVDNLIAAGGIQKATVPKCIANGDYLVRFEILALHSASKPGDAQFYMECAQVRVTGGTGAETPTTVSIPGVYKANDPGVTVMIWNNFGKPYPSSYSVPGPRPFQCSGSSSEGNNNTVETNTPVKTNNPVKSGACSSSKGGKNGGGRRMFKRM